MSIRNQSLGALFGRASGVGRRGFTMIEILIVLSILGIMTTLAVVSFTKVMDQSRVDRAATTLSYDLQLAFALVGRNRKPVRITWDSTNVRFNVTDRTDTLFRTRPMGLSSEFKLRRTDFTVSRPILEIYPPGLANDSLNIRIVNRDTKRTISVARGGLVRVLRK